MTQAKRGPARHETPPEIAAAAKPQDRPNPSRSGPQRADTGRDDWWWSGAMQALQALAATGRIFTAYDLTAEPYAIPEPDHCCRWGALLRTGHTRGLITPVGATISQRPQRAGGLTRTWRGVTR